MGFEDRQELVDAAVALYDGFLSCRKCVAGEFPFTNFGHLTDDSLLPSTPSCTTARAPGNSTKLTAREFGH